MVCNDNFTMQVKYYVKPWLYTVGRMEVIAPVTIKPGRNKLQGKVVIVKSTDDEPGMKAFISNYIGPQSGFMPAGSGSDPLLVHMAEGSSNSTLVQQVLEDLTMDLNFKPKPMTFLVALTADVMLYCQREGLCSVVLHARLRNPLPQVVKVQRIKLDAWHKDKHLYQYDHNITSEPDFNPDHYVMEANEELTLDFKLKPFSESSKGWLSSPTTVTELLGQAVSKTMSARVSVDIDVLIGEFEQRIHYENSLVECTICYHLSEPEENCGALEKSKEAKANAKAAGAKAEDVQSERDEGEEVQSERDEGDDWESSVLAYA